MVTGPRVTDFTRAAGAAIPGRLSRQRSGPVSGPLRAVPGCNRRTGVRVVRPGKSMVPAPPPCAGAFPGELQGLLFPAPGNGKAPASGRGGPDIRGAFVQD